MCLSYALISPPISKDGGITKLSDIPKLYYMIRYIISQHKNKQMYKLNCCLKKIHFYYIMYIDEGNFIY